MKLLLKFIIPNHGELLLDFPSAHFNKFSDCKLLYKNNSVVELYEDYLYVFVESMLNNLNNTLSIDSTPHLFGALGKWQEYFYYTPSFTEMHQEEIMQMKQSIFMSTVAYGLFLYRYKDEYWLEIDKSYSDSTLVSPKSYYLVPSNYRVLLANLHESIVKEWKKQLKNIHSQFA